MKTIYYLLALVLILLLIIVFLIFKIKKDAAHYYSLTSLSISSLDEHFTDTTCIACPSSGSYETLEFDDDSRDHITEWERALSNGTATYRSVDDRTISFNLRDVQNMQGVFISRDDLQKMLCNLPEGDGFGVAIKMGMSGDGSEDAPRKLMPYVSGAKMSVSISGEDKINVIHPFDLTRYAEIGAPLGTWR